MIDDKQRYKELIRKPVSTQAWRDDSLATWNKLTPLQQLEVRLERL